MGSWVLDKGPEEGTYYKKAVNLLENEAGYTFKKEVVLVVRQNAGSCGTPPISYADYKGTWVLESKNILKLTYPFWGGTVIMEWEILAIEKKLMRVKRKSLDLQRDKRK